MIYARGIGRIRRFYLELAPQLDFGPSVPRPMA